MANNVAVASTFHPDLRLARLLPRGVGTPFRVWLFRRLPFPPVKIPPSLTLTVRRIDPAREAEVYIIEPKADGAPRPALLWMHGGGYMVGSPQQDLAMCARLAERLDMVVVAVDYRLAPEHPFPAPLEDCYAAFELMHREAAALGIDRQRIVIGGASAGGGLAAALTLMVHDRQRRAPAMQLLVYPMLDDRTIAAKDARPYHRVWDRASNERGWRAYLGSAFGSIEVPDHAAPARRRELAGLPPTWIGVGTFDLFHDEDVAYAERLRKAGVPTTLEVVDGAFHGFDQIMPSKPVSQRFFDAQVSALAKQLGLDQRITH